MLTKFKCSVCPVSKNNGTESQKYCQENAGQEHYASIISQTQYVCLLTGEWQQ